MANWRDLFRVWILDLRQIVESDDDSDLIRAEVSDSQVYHLEIWHSGKRLDWISCDCSYADKDEHCRHRQKKTRCLGLKTIPAVILRMEQHIPFLYEGYERYVSYWNGKLVERTEDAQHWQSTAGK